MKMRYLLCIIFVAFIVTPTASVFASEQDFYVSDFTADYYLTKQEGGTSKLHVKEVLTAVFPETDQNHGITRDIPYTNQNGKNRTIDSKAALNFTVLKNGKPETVNKISDSDGFFRVYIGDASEYVHGEQVYTMEYDYTDVITEFAENGENVSGREGVKKIYQELYWDTNGTGWRQRFDHITARLHLPQDIYDKTDRQAWCYVGKYGSSGQDRCTIEQIQDGFSFSADTLNAYENLTFVTKFLPETFGVVLEKDYVLIIVLVLEALFIAILLGRAYYKWRTLAKPQYDLYKSLFVAPQYQPPADSSVNAAEAEQVYMKNVESSYVATLLELVVSKKVTLKRLDEKKKPSWAVVLNVELNDLTVPQRKMIDILYGKHGATRSTEIPIKKHIATRYLALCDSSYRAAARGNMESRGYLQRILQIKDKPKRMSFATFVALMYVVFPIVLIVFATLSSDSIESFGYNRIIVGGSSLFVGEIIALVVTLIINYKVRKKTNQFQKYTEDGINLANYLDGLELYIKMAEADRLKFLQSVEGVDVSNEGIVKIYERLLPWASLFGVEESWVNELSKYYKIEAVEEALSTDVINGLVSSSIAHDLTRAIASSTHYVEPSSHSGGGSDSSSGGSWSSDSSGSSGGGFSGGGGGGGGGGGW